MASKIINLLTYLLTSRVNSLSVAVRAGYLSVRTAEGACEKQSSLKVRLRNGLTYLLTYVPEVTVTLSPFAQTTFVNPLLYPEVYFVFFDFWSTVFVITV